MNGDGYADVIVGAPSYDNGQTDEGRAFVYLGSAAGLADRARLDRRERPGQRAYFGASVATAGDVNGDGYADVIVGAPPTTTARTDEGACLRLPRLRHRPGHHARLDRRKRPDRRLLRRLGGTAGDVNGDGYADVIVGAPDYDNGQTDEGRGLRLPRLRRRPGGHPGLDRRERPGQRPLRLVRGDSRGRQRQRQHDEQPLWASPAASPAPAPSPTARSCRWGRHPTPGATLNSGPKTARRSPRARPMPSRSTPTARCWPCLSPTPRRPHPPTHPPTRRRRHLLTRRRRRPPSRRRRPTRRRQRQPIHRRRRLPMTPTPTDYANAYYHANAYRYANGDGDWGCHRYANSHTNAAGTPHRGQE